MPFFLKSPTSTTPTLIYLCYHFNGRRLKMSTGEKILPRDWNFTKHRPRANGVSSQYYDTLEAKVKAVHLKLKSTLDYITPAILRAAIERESATGGKRITFMEFMPDGPVRKLLKSFPIAKDFEDITPAWCDAYEKFLTGKGYAVNYIGKNISTIIQAIAKAHGDGLTRNQVSYKVHSEATDSIYLTEDELLKIYGIELPPALDRIRERFILGAFTGLRFSDSSVITPDSIRNGLIFDKNQKTGTQVVIPIHWVVRQIMDFHPEGLPRSCSNANTNKYIKVIGRMAGIKQWDKITTHTGRRSALTNMYLAGVPALSIMKISGHSTQSSFMRYIKMSAEESARNIMDHKFFKERGI